MPDGIMMIIITMTKNMMNILTELTLHWILFYFFELVAEALGARDNRREAEETLGPVKSLVLSGFKSQTEII